MRTDKLGNKLIVERSKYHTQLYVDLYIKLPTEKHRRHVGTINVNTRTLHLHRSKTKHLLIKANAYGYNHYILSEGTLFDDVVIHEEETSKIYSVNKQFILNEGIFLHFKTQGFERQIFTTLEWLSYYEVLSEVKKNNLYNVYHKLVR